MKIDSKIKVFVSSNCGIEEFDLLRKKIKNELEKTKLINVFLFENQASTLPTIPAYTMKLEDSDVCIFLLEDKEIPNGVKREIDRANKTNKKSLYYFCGTKAKETTLLKYSLIESKNCVFNVVNSFSEFLKCADNLVNEIIQIYHYYCRDWMINKETVEEQLSAPHNDESISSKSMFKSSDRSKNCISNFLFADNTSIENTDDFDLSCSKFLDVLLNGKSIYDYNLSLLLESIKAKQSAQYFEITNMRWQAIQKYFLGDKTGCLERLKDALKVAKSNAVTEWIIKDILIDLRNLDIMIDNEKGRVYISNEAQDELDASQSALYYPVLDRYDKELYEGFLERDIKESLKSPYTITFGDNLNGLINNLTNTYMVTMYNGSLTHIRAIYKRLRDCAFYLCKNYSNWSFRMALCKTMVVEYGQKDFGRMEVLFKDILERINADDAKCIFDFSFNLSTGHERKCAILTAFTHMGNYLNDEDFKSASDYILEISNHWLTEPNAFLGNYIFPALQKNAQRMDSEKILEFALKALKAGFIRFLPDIYKTITNLNLTACACSSLVELEKLITSYLEDNPDFSFSRIDNLLIKLKKENLCSDSLFDILKEKYPQKYKGTILLNTTTNSEDLRKFIDSYILEIDSRNKTQGVNGYIGYATNPYQVIESLVKDGAELDEDNAERIVSSSLNTLIAERQTIDDKINAIRLILVTINRYNFKQEFLSHLPEEIERNLSTALEFGKILSNTSQFSLRYGINLLRIRLNSTKYIREFVGQSIELNSADTIDKINCIRLLSAYLDGLNFSAIDRDLQFIMKNLILTARLSDVHDIGYYATIAVLKILPYEKDMAREQLYNVMNNDNCYLKNLVVQHLSEIKIADEDIYSNIVKKGLQDSNFFVRNNTKIIVSQIEKTE